MDCHSVLRSGIRECCGPGEKVLTELRGEAYLSSFGSWGLVEKNTGKPWITSPTLLQSKSQLWQSYHCRLVYTEMGTLAACQNQFNAE
jgi:hypothetical protein